MTQFCVGRYIQNLILIPTFVYKMRFFAAALFFLGAAVSYSQPPEVPHKMQFAGMTLTIKDDARREIQKDVDALTQHPYYFNIKVERAKTYFPIVEQIFREERLPDDFKYLAIQESALISDAVSVSDAVGFWQFKDFTAEEMGLRVDKEIDERMNLISASRGAAKYLKQNNFYFNNWIYALQAYQMGAGGAMRAVGEKHNGAKHMDIDKHTYWYVKKYLAHKIAFENAIHGEAQLKLTAIEVDKKTSLDEIAGQFDIAAETIAEYNKWALKGVIPGDRKYTVLVPKGSYDQNFTKLAIVATPSPVVNNIDNNLSADLPQFINGVPAIAARPGDQLTTLADRGGVSLTAFIKYNDISIDHKIKPGQLYFIDKKKKTGIEDYHKVKSGENLWLISQANGMQLKKLAKYNRVSRREEPKENTMLWLTSMKPPVSEIDSESILEVNSKDEFNWGPVTSTEDLATLGNESLVSISEMESVDNGQNQGAAALANPGISNAMVNNDSLPSITLHIVKPSETLYSVSRQYGVTIKELMDWNEKRDFTVSVGEKLRIMLH